MVYENIITYLLTIIGILITLIIPLPIPEEYRLTIIAGILLLFISIILSNFNKKIDEQKIEQSKLSENLKTIERLSKLEVEIEYLKKNTYPASP